MKITKESAVAFTGHRMMIASDGKRGVELELMLRERLQQLFSELYAEGKTCYLNGMALGFDMLCAEEVLKFKVSHPDVKLILAIPFMGQELMYPDSQKRRYADIYHSADSNILIWEDGYNADAYHLRNDFLVENSSFLVAFGNGRPRSGTTSTIRKATQQNTPIVNLYY